MKPGAYPVPTKDGWWRPPHVHFSLFGKVWLSRLVTQMYFPGAPQGRAPHINVMVMFSGLMRILKTTIFFGNSSDPVLGAVPLSRQKLLISTREKAGLYRFDIRLRGDNETPFFDD